MTDLTPLAPAFRDLIEANDVPSVKAIRDRSIAIEAYAREARDPELINHAVEVRLKAERKAGDLLRGMAERGERARGGGDIRKESHPATLSDLGVTKTQSYRWQALAALGEEDFAARLSDAQRAAASAIELTAEQRKREKQERRSARESDLAVKIKALPVAKFGVIYADPEWRFEPYSRETGMDRAADNHYSTSPIDVIASRPVESIAADDCVLFLWATVPMLPEALDVMASWGFEYKSHLIWLKDAAGTGYWNRNRHELLLIGTRGDVPAPAPGTQYESVIEAPAGEHSEKPPFFYELIEYYFPNIPKIELNARARRDGWDAWGLEAPEQAP